MPHRARLLGFAFANADFLFEMDPRGTILFAAGAANDLVRENGEALTGRPAATLFKPSEGSKFITFTQALKSGDRSGPYKLTLATGAEASLAMFKLPENDGRISCTLARGGAKAETRSGLPSRDGFLAAAELAGDKDALTLVDVPGLPELCAQLSPDNAEALMKRIGESLQASGASAAGQISETSFGAVSSKKRGKLGLVQRITDAITAGGLAAPKVAETQIGLGGAGLSKEQRLLTLRYVIDRFAEKGRLDGGEVDVADAFGAMMEETQSRLAAMTRAVGEGAFEMAFQPICSLTDGHVSHYEALARFATPHGTGDTIKFIEALGIADTLDLAVANKILDVAERNPADIAFNVSGATIASPASFGVLASLLARRRKLARHILIEITETSAIYDLESAAKAVSGLREMGFRVGLDDFGAGSASLNYLHAIPVDFVKFDGALIRKIGSSQRDDAMLSGLAKLCREMGIITIAECIESEGLARAALALGFVSGQGRWLGAPAEELPLKPQPIGKRQGVKEFWG